MKMTNMTREGLDVMNTMIISVAMLLALSGTALAAHPLITDDTGTQGKNRYQLEVTGESSRDKENLDGVATREAGAELAVAVSAGLCDTIDLVVGVPWTWSRLREDGLLTGDEQGIGDASLELKWRFLELGGFSLAVKPGITIPTGNEHKGLGNGKFSYGTTLIASQELGPVTLHVNGAYTRNEYKLAADKELNRHDIWHASVAGVYRAAENLQLVANYGVESNGEHGADAWPAFLLGGVIYTVTGNLDLDLGVKRGLNGPEADLSYLAGVAYRF